MIITCYYHISFSICVWLHIKQAAIVITRWSLYQDVRFFTRHSSITHRQVIFLPCIYPLFSYDHSTVYKTCTAVIENCQNRETAHAWTYVTILFFYSVRNLMVYVRITVFIIVWIYIIQQVRTKEILFGFFNKKK